MILRKEKKKIVFEDLKRVSLLNQNMYNNNFYHIFSFLVFVDLLLSFSSLPPPLNSTYVLNEHDYVII